MSKTLAQSLARTLGVVSTESVDVDINIGNDAVVDEDGAVVSPLAPATDEPIIEAQQTELSEEESGIAETSDDLDDADTDTETLESIQLILEKSMEHGGLDTPSFEMFNVTMDHIYRKYGLSAAQVMPSMEAFGEDKLANTQISMEKSMASAKSIAEGAKELLKKLWFQIKKFIKNLLTMNLAMKKRVAAVKTKAQAVNDDTSYPEIKLYSAAKLSINGKVPAKGEIIAAYAKTGTGMTELEVTSNKYFDIIAGIIDNRLGSDLQFDVTDLEKHAAIISDISKFLAFQDARFEIVNEDSRFRKTGVKFATTPMQKRGDDSDVYKVVPLTTSEIIATCNKIQISMIAVDKMNTLFSKSDIEKRVVKLSDMTGPLPKAKKEGDDVKNSNANATKSDIKNMRKLTKLALSNHARVISYITGVNKAMLDYCVQSLDAIEKGSKAADKPANK